MTEFKVENDVDDSEDTDDDQRDRGEDYVANQQKLRHEVNVIRNNLTIFLTFSSYCLLFGTFPSI